MSATPIRSVFLDRDGVINRRLMDDYVTRWDDFEFLPGVLDAIARLTSAGLSLAVVTNQRGVALGRMSLSDVHDLHDRMVAHIRAGGGDLERIEVCPDASGPDRKPEPGMLLRVMQECDGFTPETSVIVGDSASDIVAGQRAGVLGILVGSTIEEEQVKLDRPAWREAADLSAAVDLILATR